MRRKPSFCSCQAGHNSTEKSLPRIVSLLSLEIKPKSNLTRPILWAQLLISREGQSGCQEQLPMISPQPRLYHYRVWSSYLPLLERFVFGDLQIRVVLFMGASLETCGVLFVWRLLKMGGPREGLYMNMLMVCGWGCESRGIQMKETARRCPSHHLCSEVHISSPCSLLILCYLYLRSTINMQNSQKIKFPSQELQGKTDYSVDLRWRQTLMAFLIDHRRVWGNHLCGASAPAGREQTGAFSVSVLALYHMTQTTSIPAWHTHPSYYVVRSV